MEKSKVIFGNVIDDKVYNKALKTQKKFIKKFGDDRNVNYCLEPEAIPCLKGMGVKNLRLSEGTKPMKFPENAVIVGNIRMGFGHYRIAMAMASCAKALGYEPYWFDLTHFDKSTGSKILAYQNNLYSMGSKLSQKSKLFNKLYWDPLNSEGFRQISYNSGDQKNAELLVPLYYNLPKDVPFIGTHVWPSQGAIHAGLTHVVNAIPDNWPMGLHLAEGSIHTVQTPFAYFGYKMLNGMAKTPLKGIPEDQLKEVGHYIDHELVVNIDKDCEARIARIKKGEPLRILLTVGGAGAGAPMFASIIKHLLPYVKEKKVALFMNFGDHLKVWNYLCKKVKGFEGQCTKYFDEYDKVLDLVKNLEKKHVEGIHVIYNKDIFEAVYSTNLLMRHVEVLVTKPSELAYYPVPKLMMKHIGGHEVYGAVHAQEEGDSTFECPTVETINPMFDRLIEDKELLIHMCKQIQKLNQQHMYDGGYEVIKLAVGEKAKGNE